MKKIYCFLICTILLTSGILVNASSEEVYSYNSNNEQCGRFEIRVQSNDTELIFSEYSEISENKKETACENALPLENYVLFDIKSEAGTYPEVDDVSFSLELDNNHGGGHNNAALGKDYRVLYFTDDITVEDVSADIISNSIYNVSVETDRLGTYAVYFNPDAYKVVFYSDYNIDEDYNETEVVYAEINDLAAEDIIEFPEFPEKEGYVFAGWKTFRGNGIYFLEPETGITARHCGHYYASWIAEDEYEPITISTTTEGKIKYGKENGKKIKLTTNYGTFIEDLPTEWRNNYEAATDENVKEEILNEWKGYWNISGNDELLVESVERIDDKTVELTLSGNSRSGGSQIYIGFASEFLLDEIETNGEINDGRLIKMDENGIKASMYYSDNTVSLSKTVSSGGGSSTVLVGFETNGGEKLDNRRYAWGEKAELPVPVKDGFVFEGWYTDSELTQKADSKFKQSATLYAKWEPENKEENQLIMFVGKDSAKAFGKEVNGNAPVVNSGKLYLPLRFVAESFGGKVEWNGDNRQITVTYLDNSAVIDLENMTASANGFTVNAEGELFVINSEGRTYISADFVNKVLGSIITFDAKTNKVVIEK